jgi:head-tail adaptor
MRLHPPATVALIARLNAENLVHRCTVQSKGTVRSALGKETAVWADVWTDVPCYAAPETAPTERDAGGRAEPTGRWLVRFAREITLTALTNRLVMTAGAAAGYTLNVTAVLPRDSSTRVLATVEAVA